MRSRPVQDMLHLSRYRPIIANSQNNLTNKALDRQVAWTSRRTMQYCIQANPAAKPMLQQAQTMDREEALVSQRTREHKLRARRAHNKNQYYFRLRARNDKNYELTPGEPWGLQWAHNIWYVELKWSLKWNDYYYN